jgi:hypothetical protein
MDKIEIDGLDRAEARKFVMSLPRNQAFITDILEDGRKIYFITDGGKDSLENGNKLEGHFDITVHFEGEPKRKFSYINDILVFMLKNERALGEKGAEILLKAVKDSIELVPIKEIYKRYPELNELEKKRANHSIDFLLAILKILALQEDVNYWGINPKTKKPYEGREKPYHALYDLLVKKMPLTHLTRKHRLY